MKKLKYNEGCSFFDFIVSNNYVMMKGEEK